MKPGFTWTTPIITEGRTDFRTTHIGATPHEAVEWLKKHVTDDEMAAIVTDAWAMYECPTSDWEEDLVKTGWYGLPYVVEGWMEVMAENPRGDLNCLGYVPEVE